MMRGLSYTQTEGVGTYMQTREWTTIPVDELDALHAKIDEQRKTINTLVLELRVSEQQRATLEAALTRRM